MTKRDILTEVAALKTDSEKARVAYEKRIVAAIDSGHTYRAVAAAAGVNVGAIQHIVNKQRR